jgi:benzodiazapine receptor
MKQLSLIAFIALVFAISGISSLVTMPAVQGWYQTLQKPGWNPPDWVFGPVWTMLYLMIAVAGWRVWNRLPAAVFSQRFMHHVMRPYWLQLLFNFAWSLLFFGLKSPLAGAFDIVLLLAAIGWNIQRFRTVDRVAAWLLVPYLLWVCYATSLNFAILALN